MPQRMPIMNMEAYEKQIEKIYRDLEISEEQIEQGAVGDAKEHLASLMEKL